ncbi:MAG: hypothetical protein QOK00_3004 [Thermoleophilaceae bacterium]|jgi:hypothetical protein|nr:hypothetical protein [Thermoleophilaceae bacterium]MEA2402601.1 hypothetical protein [Thermoleophilaceae bacterium]
MSYAAPFSYAAKAIAFDPYAPTVASHHSRPARRRRRRMRAMLLPALSPRRHQATVPTTLVPSSSR